MSDELEQWILGGLMLDRDVVSEVLVRLVPTHFHSPAHRDIFRVVQGLWANHEPIDAITVAARLDRYEQLSSVGGAAYLHTLISAVPTAADTVDYANALVKRPR